MSPPRDGWYVYVLECADGTLYTGIARDVERRLKAHNARTGARYTRARTPVELIGSTGPMDWGDALRLEKRTRVLRPAAKRRWIADLAGRPPG